MPRLTELHELIDAIPTERPQDALGALRRLQQLLPWMEALAVDQARAEGWTWSEIGRALGVTKQGAQQRHGRRPPVERPPRPATGQVEDVWARQRREAEALLHQMDERRREREAAAAREAATDGAGPSPMS